MSCLDFGQVSPLVLVYAVQLLTIKSQNLILLLVPGSLSWRVPLGIQIIPGIILALGCFFLPPSPRLLVLKGRYDEALASLARLRLRTPEEADSDLLLHVRLIFSFVSVFRFYH